MAILSAETGALAPNGGGVVVLVDADQCLEANGGGASSADGARAPRKGPARRRGRPRLGESARLDARLLEHALEHFLERGFDGTTINAITASLGMSKQTVYSRYGDKIALFRAALGRAIDEWLVPLERLADLEGDDIEQTLIDVGKAIVSTLMSPAGLRLIRITNAESYRMPEIGAYTYHHGHERIALFLRDLFRRRIFADTSDCPDLDDLATTFLNLMSGPARRSAWGLGDEGTDVERFVRQQVHLFLHGVMPIARA